jgi:eukaryotic-like serine/threonine-protein kinase
MVLGLKLEARYARGVRSKVADFEVMEALAPTVDGRVRYLCRAPERLAGVERVMITEVDVDASGWNALVEKLTRWSAVGADRLLNLLEAGPDLDPAGAGVYVASEYPSGGRLGDQKAELDVAARVQAVADAARGAHALHEAGLAHGAINLNTVVLTERGGVLGPPPVDQRAGLVTRITDWRDFVTMDPDLLCGEAPGRATDIWSLGATVHLAASDRPLFHGIDADEPVTAVQRMLFTRPEIDPALGPELAETVAACLDPDPEARPATAAEVAERLTDGVAP